ncbi:hypothetical protein ASC64_18705 [Nocardioides sp. Root122]|uniref:DUF3352 domain-containing protein n=1 Tax=Nocardioides TaxID=1839 RepID=UPI000703013F|nr:MULTISPECIES: DUF3352 domain-containing protein [Nocardioides]KQV73471.1 hypothetical protein ASC64_18705 [Nocardioides sp. Root122]MCK9825270.1 DUF3352 domain-containing protein [Nocardioides cavernae]
MSTTPGGPEYLDTTGPADAAPTNDNRKRLIALGALGATAVVVAGGAWAATSFFATGSQPAEALPDSTIAYASIDLDPSGGQKIEAIKTLRKFPGFTDKIDLQTDDDLRERLFEEITKSGACEGLDYAKDVKPWLGSRAAMAAVDLGEDEPAAVGVIQVTDGAKAEDGMSKLVDTCGGGEDAGGEVGGWVVDGDWMVISETKEIATEVVDAADGGSLADDSAFGTWTGEAGDDGFMSFYLAKGVTKYAEDFAGMGSMMGGPSMMSGADTSAGPDEDCIAEATTSEEMQACFDEATDESSDDTGSEEVPPELQQLIDDFDGAAATVRFDDGAVEIEYAMSNYQEDMTKYMESDEGVSMVGGLPDDTVAAFGLALTDGWGEAMLDYLKTTMPEESDTIDEQLAELESETGLSIPADLETLMGDGMTLSLGSGIDPDAIANGGPGEVPVGLKIKGDADEIQAVLDKIAAQAPPEMAELMQVTEGDGYAVLALQDDYRSKLESAGDLGDSEDYEKVVESDDAQSVLYVNFDADDDWLVRVTEDMPEVSENVEPLSAFGISGWVDGDVAHGLFKLTTD